MNPLTQSKKTVIRPLLVALALGCVALPPASRALLPPPPSDGGYPHWNTAEGTNALFHLTGGIYNTALGGQALYSTTGGSYNTAVGLNALYSNNGWYNTANGFEALFHNTIGTQNTATGVNALISNTIGSKNTANGVNSLYINTTGDENTATGVNALVRNTIGLDNTANGFEALYSNVGGVFNTANGAFALFSNTDGSGNTAVGNNTLKNNNGGFNNTAIGIDALLNNISGGSNIALGNGAASFISTASNVICIGANGANVDNTTWIGNVYGATTQNGATAPVIVSADGQLGTASSARRFKKKIKPMESASEAILALKPVTFHYKSDETGTPQFGLIAEEVAEANPDLVIRDRNGEIYTVRYDAVNVMLLNEFLKEHSKVEKLEATIAKQRTDFEAALADLKGQIQIVSAQLQLNKTAPQTVLNNQ